jgi:hypothetical protein
VKSRFDVIHRVCSGQRPELPDASLPIGTVVARATAADAGDGPPPLHMVTPGLRALIEACWAQEPDDRPTIRHVVRVLSELEAEAKAAEVEMQSMRAGTGQQLPESGQGQLRESVLFSAEAQ